MTIKVPKIPKKRLQFPTKAQLKTVDIVNPVLLSQIEPDDVSIVFTKSTAHERGGIGARYRVRCKDLRTDRNAHWMDHGLKTFTTFGGDHSAVVRNVQMWADKQYGPRVWVKDPWGSYQEGRTIAKAWEMIDEKFPRACRTCDGDLTPAEMALGAHICDDCITNRAEEREDRRKMKKER